MNRKKIVVVNMAMLGAMSGAWGEQIYTGTQHIGTLPDSWYQDVTIVDALGWQGGLYADNAQIKQFIIGGNITSSENHVGLFFREDASATFNSNASGRLFTASNNRWEGILVENGARLTVEGMNIRATGTAMGANAITSDGNGMRADDKATITLSHADEITLDRNRQHGLYANRGSTVNIIASGMLSLNGNGGRGLAADDSSRINILDARSLSASGNDIGIHADQGGNIAIERFGLLSFDRNGQQGLKAERGSVIYLTQGGNVSFDGNASAGAMADDRGALTLHGVNTVTASDNLRHGLYAYNHGTITFFGHDPSSGITSLLQANNNNTDTPQWGGAGIWAENRGKIEIQNTDVEVMGNGMKGIKLFNDGEIILAGDGSQRLTVTGNGTGNTHESYYGGVIIEQNSQLTISGMDVQLDNNGKYGLVAATHGAAWIGSVAHSNRLTASGNQHTGIAAQNSGSTIVLEQMSAEANDNGEYGIHASNGGQIALVGTGGQGVKNSLTASGNRNRPDDWSDGAGLAAEGSGEGNASAVDIVNMNVNATANGRYGIAALGGGAINIQGDGSHTLNALNNVTSAANPWAHGAGIYAGSKPGESASEISAINIAGMNINVAGNDFHAIHARDGGQVAIFGLANNTLNIEANNSASGNDGNGILADRANDSGEQSLIHIQDMDVQVENQAYQGIAARDGGWVNITSTTGGHRLEVSNTRMHSDSGQDLAKGIHAKELDAQTGAASTVSISNMNVSAWSNELEGLAAAHGGQIYLTSDSGHHTLSASGNRKYIDGQPDRYEYGAGLLAHGVSEHDAAKQAGIALHNMNVEANDNGLYGIYVRDGGQVSISGNGQHKLDASGNKSTVYHTWDAGLAVEGLTPGGTSATPSAVRVRDMEVTINDNGRYGIDLTRGGQLTFASRHNNGLTVTGNQTGDITGSQGIGINVAGTEGGQRSQLLIANMNVAAGASPDAGIKVADGGQIDIVSHSGHSLRASGNDNRGTQYNQGSGLWVSDIGRRDEGAATLNLAGMNITATDNGSYGLLAEGGHLNIAGNGRHALNLAGNGRYGLLATESGTVHIRGMRLAGDSNGHALVAIERDGEINLSDSTLTTGNDALFYSWSDDDRQRSRFNLDNVAASGHGSRLAQFNAHHSALEARNSLLENAIVTAPAATSVVDLEESRWAMHASSNISQLNINNSLVDMRGRAGYNTLTLNRLTSGDTRYLLNTWFDTPGLTTDKIIVAGDDATGSGNVLKVHATGYTDGTQVIDGYGIQVVNLDTATDKSVDFSLHGGVVDSGAWEYYLYRAADDNYYLQTDAQPAPTTTAETITNIPAVHLSMVKAGMKEFRHRITELREYETFHPDELWVRTFGKRLKVDDTINSRMDLYGIEAGYDREVKQDDDNKYYAGVMAGYLYARNIRHHNAGYPDGHARANAPSLGLYGVWDNRDGWYSYATLRHYWSRMKAENRSSAGDKILYWPNRNFIAASLELGRQFTYPRDDDNKWIVEPKGELRFAHAGSQSYKTNLGYKIHYGDSPSFTTRGAVLLGYNHRAESGAVYEPFIEVGASREWAGKTDVTYAGGHFTSRQKGNDYDFSLGLRTKWAVHWSFMGSLNYETGAVHQGLGASLAVRYSW